MSGALQFIGRKSLGLYAENDYFRCSDCGTDYPRIDGVIRCNGFTISSCPWCGTDKRSNRAGECRS
jgi:rubrerythrin